MQVLVSRIDTIIAQYGLKPATRRRFPLLTLSCIAEGYTHVLRRMFGISAHAVGGLGSRDEWHTMLNEQAIGDGARVLIQKYGADLDGEVFIPVRAALVAWTKEWKVIEPLITQDPQNFFQRIVRLYPTYLACLGLYNCFWRYIGDRSDAEGLSKKEIDALGAERDIMAKIYPEVESQIASAVKNFGDAEGFDGDLLRYATYRECVDGKADTHDHEWLSELARRRDRFFYLYAEEGAREYLITHRKMIAEIERRYYTIDTTVKEVQGNIAHAGFVQGTVFNLAEWKGAKPEHLAPGTILVAGMTHPSDSTLIREAAAIVTDEGGILCHASILAREFKIPTVIGTKIATRVFHDGDRVEFDAVKGIVRKI
ncbi:hypothetical protein HY624_01495 [Candidatus Uhrbacteria bacterium]|nr:hypothetical protein [Candidatus Uhrbacteria bacterium]